MQITLIDKIREAGSSFTFTEEDLFDQVAGEVASNSRKDGLWTKALSESGMNEDKAKALYIKLRVDQLHTEAIGLLEKLRAEEHSKLLNLLDEAKKDRIIAAEELSKATQLRIEFDEQKIQNIEELKSKTDEFDRERHYLKEKLEMADGKILELIKENKLLQSNLSDTSGKFVYSLVALAITVVFLLSQCSSNSKTIEKSNLKDAAIESSSKAIKK